MFKKSNRGFTLIELLTVMGIMAVLGGVAMSNYFSYQSSVNIDGAANELLGTLRDAQQRAISQDSQAAWGVNINAPADNADYYELFSGPNYSSGTVISRTTLSSDLYFLLPAQGSSKEIDFAKSTGLPNGNYAITIASQRNSSLFRTITINTTTGLVTLESGLSGAPAIVSITPTTALNFSPINITSLSGVNFLSGATFKLSKTGLSDVICTNVVFVNSQNLTGTCDITGIATGAWDVVVTNPDSQVATLPGAFLITNSSTPGVPTLTSTYPSEQQVTLNWQAPTSDGGSSITHYEIYRSTSSGGETFLAETGNVLTYVDTGLTTGSTYYYKVSAKNITGEGILSNELSAFIGSARIFVTSTTYNGNLGGLSGANSLCAARATAVGLTGTWKAWLSDGTANASSTLYHGTVPYINMHGDKVANNWTGLTSGTLLAPIQYNESGAITAGQAWTGSYSDGTSYFTQNCVNWTSSTGTGSDAGLSGLVSSTGSQWSLLGTNSCNTLLPLYCVEQLTPPSAPLNLTATPSTSNIVLNWQAPASDGGSSITNYKIYRGISSGSETYYGQVSGSTLTYTDSIVSGGTTYYYKVTAINLSLESQYSNEASGSLIVLTVPSQPQNLIVSGGDLSSTLTWQAPTSDGNSAITNYKVYRGTTSGGETLLTSGGCSGLGNVLTCTDTGLTNGTTYYYKVSAMNAIGEGSLSSESSATPTTPEYIWTATTDYDSVKRINVNTGENLRYYSGGSGSAGLAVDSSGYPWVSQLNSNNGHTVTKLNLLNADAPSYGVLATYEAGLGSRGVAIDSSGNVWVTNFSNNTVTKLNSSGTIIGTYSVGTNPWGIAIDSVGNVWVVNNGGNNVTQLNSSGSLLGTYSVGTSPRSIAIDYDDNAWVTNYSTNNVTKLSSTGSILGTYSVGNGPMGIAVDLFNRIWVANNSSNTVTKLSSVGSVLGTFSNYFTNGPIGVGVDSTSNVFVSGNAPDYGHAYFAKFDPSGYLLASYNLGDVSYLSYCMGDLTGFALKHFVLDYKRVFVTSTTYNGNLGGLSGADAKCQARADAVGLGGIWKAWLSDETTDASSRLGHSTSPYVNMHGSIVANNWTDLTDGAISASIQYNESGVAVAGQAWTGSYSNGLHYFSQDCTAWTSTTGTGADAGLSGIVTSTTGTWSNNGANSCNTVLPLYCVEQPNDVTPPSAIANLAGSNATLTSIDVSWTSPGDDGVTGTATSYDLRYSTSAINDSNFASATQVSGEPTPLVAGSTQSMTISGLTTNVTYYFAIKTTDDMANTSSISNSPSFATKHYTAIVFATPASRTLTPDCIQYPVTTTGCSSKPYFYCSPWVDGSLVSVDSPGTGRTINYQGAYSTRSAAISATISSMAACFSSNGYSLLSYNGGAPDFVHGNYRGCSGTFPNIGGCVGNWQYVENTGGYYLRPANTLASYYNAQFYYFSYTGVFEQIQYDPICPDCLGDYYVRMLSYDCTPDTYGYKPQLGECASVNQTVLLYSNN